MGERRGLIRAALFFAFAHVLTIGGTSAGPAIALALAAFVGRIPVRWPWPGCSYAHRSIWAPLGLHATFNATLLILAEVVAPLAPPPV